MSERDFTFPHWLSGRPPKQLEKASTPLISKGNLAKCFAKQWLDNSKEIIKKIVDSWVPNFDKENFLDELKNYIDKLLATYLATQKSPLKIPKELVIRVDSFEILNEQFSSYVNRVAKDLPTDSKAFIDQVNELVNESRFFIASFNATVDLVFTGKQFSFRPADREKKHAFLQAVIACSTTKRSDKFPPYKVLIESKELEGFTIPARTYGLWKRQIIKGTFHFFTQPRKNRQ